MNDANDEHDDRGWALRAAAAAIVSVWLALFALFLVAAAVGCDVGPTDVGGRPRERPEAPTCPVADTDELAALDRRLDARLAAVEQELLAMRGDFGRAKNLKARVEQLEQLGARREARRDSADPCPPKKQKPCGVR
jgi:hypothetical protein